MVAVEIARVGRRIRTSRGRNGRKVWHKEGGLKKSYSNALHRRLMEDLEVAARVLKAAGPRAEAGSMDGGFVRRAVGHCSRSKVFGTVRESAPSWNDVVKRGVERLETNGRTGRVLISSSPGW